MTGIGIDLGTSNIAAASHSEEQRRVIGIKQEITPQAVDHLQLLPSFLYLPRSGEIGQTVSESSWVIGQLAKDRAAETPERVISSSKSWLAATHVDRKSAILPWQSDITERLSPVAAAELELRQVVKSLAEAGYSLDQQIVVTVPASFDQVARDLTAQAARAAGLGKVVILEEPLAAFYAWLRQPKWRDAVQVGDLILVCDIGGGTTDFSLIRVADAGGGVELQRVAVGQHLLLGGDNMDAALMMRMAQKIGGELGKWQLLSLLHQCRSAKERLFSDLSLEKVNLTVVGRGSSLFGGSKSVEFTRADLNECLTDAFFPVVERSARPQQSATGLLDVGLNYEADPVVSHHLAAFLAGHCQNELPQKVLFNGGVFRAKELRDRILANLARWAGSEPAEIANDNLELAVAEGAAYYGHLLNTQQKLRVHAGISHAYYIGVQRNSLAIPGIKPELRGLCVAPLGTTEGSTFDLPGRQFVVRKGQPVEFRFYSSHTRTTDKLGEEIDPSQLHESAVIRLTIPGTSGEMVTVKLAGEVTAVGALELAMHDVQSSQSWKLEIDVRGSSRN